MSKRTVATFAAGAIFGGLALTAAGGQAAQDSHRIPYGYQPVVVTQDTSLFDPPNCVVSERTRLIYRKFDGSKVLRGPWSDWKRVDIGPATKATDGTICAVQH